MQHGLRHVRQLEVAGGRGGSQLAHFSGAPGGGERLERNVRMRLGRRSLAAAVPTQCGDCMKLRKEVKGSK